MSKVRIELNHEGMRNLLRSERVQEMLEKHASEMANKSG